MEPHESSQEPVPEPLPAAGGAHALDLIRQVLDANWYRETNPNLDAGTDPAAHYLQAGAREGRAPHPLFDPIWYAAGDPDLVAGRRNPLLHFIESGCAQSRSPHPLFDPSWYLDQHDDVRAAGSDPFLHYLRYGAREGRSPHPLFDPAWYCRWNPACPPDAPLLHYLSGKGRNPHPLFDDAFYCAAVPGLADLGLAPLVHYLQRGAAQGYDPNPLFDTDWYVDNHETLEADGRNPLVHFVRTGAAEGRDPHPDFDLRWFVHRNPDAARGGRDPLSYYLCLDSAKRGAVRPPDDRIEACAVLDIPYEIRRAPSTVAGGDVCVFVTYTADGAMAEHVRLYVEALRANGFAVVLAVATPGLSRPLPAFCDACEGLIVRRNHGWDFAAWAAALALLPELWRAGRLLLTNDSLYGPTDPEAFRRMLARARASEADIVALTDSRQVRHHLMSYFVLIRASGLTSSYLRNFWNGVRSLRDKQRVIEAYEVVPIADLAAAGLRHEILFPTPAHAGRPRNPTLEDWRALLARGFPFLKVQLLRDPLAQTDPRGWDEALGTNPALRAAIAEHLARHAAGPAQDMGRPVPALRRRYRRTARLKTFYGAVESTRPMRSSDPALEVPFREPPEAVELPGPVAVIAHVFYPDLCAEIRSRLANIPVRADLFVSTDTEAKRAAIEAAFEGWPGTLTVQVFPNVGRDIAPMLVGFREVFDTYPVFLHVHSKKSPHDSRFAPWRPYLFDTLTGSPEIVRSILALLSRSDIGLVFPEHFEPVRNLLNWGGNYDAAKTLLARTGQALTKEFVLEFPSSSFYWGRSDALRALLDLGLDWTDFPAEAGQVDGTLAHAIERAILFLVEGRGYRWVKVGRADRVPNSALVPVLETSCLEENLLRVCRTLLHNRLPALETRSLNPDVVSILTRPDRRESLRPRFNLVIPTLCPDLRFGGINTALRIFEEVAAALGPEFDLRILCTSRPLDLAALREFPGWHLVTPGPHADFPRVIVDLTDQESFELDLRPNDIFLATAWWTATSAYALQERQVASFGRAPRILYLIQDHEPDFYGWSPNYGLAQATYARGSRTIALVNSEELAAFMGARYTLPDAYVVRFEINPTIAKALKPLPRERILLIYGRPGTPRNAFSTICAALARWQQADPTRAARWRIVSAGEAYSIDATGGVQGLEIVGKLSLEAYADLLSRASVGLSLMLSPHPSYPPLEMAQAGLLTITNTYGNKDLSKRSSSIFSVTEFAPEEFYHAIGKVVVQAECNIGTIVESKALSALSCALPDYSATAIAHCIRNEDAVLQWKKN